VKLTALPLSPVIWANFGDANPNKELVEINYRENIIYPSNQDVNYITISGFTIMHSASAWAPPTSYQSAAIGTNGGHHWIVENCEIINAKTNGFSMGVPKSRSFGPARGAGQATTAGTTSGAAPARSLFSTDITQIGHHIIRNTYFQTLWAICYRGNGYNSGTYIVGNYIRRNVI